MAPVAVVVAFALLGLAGLLILALFIGRETSRTRTTDRESAVRDAVTEHQRRRDQDRDE